MWKTWKVGRVTYFIADDFDGWTELVGVVAEKHDDHLIVEADGQRLWLDDSASDLFI